MLDLASHLAVHAPDRAAQPCSIDLRRIDQRGQAGQRMVEIDLPVQP
jgi:hypothetical protein